MNVAGFDAASVVSQLMQLERQAGAGLTSRKDAAGSQAAATAKLRSVFEQLASRAASLTSASVFRAHTATSDNRAVATATVTGDADPGTVTFTVTGLARAHTLTTRTDAGATAQITDAAHIAVGAGLAKLGIGGLHAGSTTGRYTLDVVAATGAASVSSTTHTGPVALTEDTALHLASGGHSITIGIAAGSYTATELATVLDAAADAAEVDVVADSDGTLMFTTRREGSAATLQIDGGQALGITTQMAAGTDGIIDVNGSAVTVNDAGPGREIQLGGSGPTLVLTGGLRAGAGSVDVVATGNRTMEAVSAAINAARGGAHASVIQVEPGQWRLHLTARTTGTAGELTVSADAFERTGGLTTTQPAVDATLVVGSGPGAFTVSSDSNTFTNMIAGAAITVAAVSDEPVTVTVARDTAGVAATVGALVTALNNTIAELGTQTRARSATTTAGPLAGQSFTRQLQTRLRAAVLGDNSAALTDAGISIDRNGTVTFDTAAFTAAYNADPTAVTALIAGDDAALTGSADRLAALAADVTGDNGLIGAAQASLRAHMARLDTQIERFEGRMLRRETALARQFSSLQTMLAGLQQQGTWLTAQLSALPTWQQ